MARRRNPPQRRVRTAEPAFSMCVAAVPDGTESDELLLSLEGELELLRTAVLYGDSVQLMSLRAGAISQVQTLHEAKTAEQFLAALGAMDYETALAFSPNAAKVGPDVWPYLAAFLLDREAWIEAARARATTPAERHQLAIAQAEIEAEVREVEQQVPQMQELLDERARATGFHELQPFLADGRIKLDGVGEFADDGEAVGRKLLTRLSEVAADSDRFLLTNETVSGLVSSLIRAGRLQIPSVAGSHAREAHINAGLVQRMPTLPNTPLDAVWEVRQALAPELGRYRAEVRNLARGGDTSAYSPEMAAVIEEQWVRDVSPALQDLERAMKGSNRVQRALKVVGKSSAVTLGAQGVLGGIAFGYFGWMPDPASLAVGAGTTLAKGGFDAAVDQWGSKRLKEMRFYYLSEADRRS